MPSLAIPAILIAFDSLRDFDLREIIQARDELVSISLLLLECQARWKFFNAYFVSELEIDVIHQSERAYYRFDKGVKGVLSESNLTAAVCQRFLVATQRKNADTQQAISRSYAQR